MISDGLLLTVGKTSYDLRPWQSRQHSGSTPPKSLDPLRLPWESLEAP